MSSKRKSSLTSQGIRVSHTKGVTAEQMSKSGAKSKDIERVVKEQLAMIDDKLQQTERSWGQNWKTYELPQTFQIMGLEKKDAQRIIYSMIVTEMERRGFQVKLILEPDITLIVLGWITELNVAEVDAVNETLKRSRITRAELTTLISNK